MVADEYVGPERRRHAGDRGPSFCYAIYPHGMVMLPDGCPAAWPPPWFRHVTPDPTPSGYVLDREKVEQFMADNFPQLRAGGR